MPRRLARSSSAGKVEKSCCFRLRAIVAVAGGNLVRAVAACLHQTKGGAWGGGDEGLRVYSGACVLEHARTISFAERKASSPSSSATKGRRREQRSRIETTPSAPSCCFRTCAACLLTHAFLQQSQTIHHASWHDRRACFCSSPQLYP